MSVFVKFWGTRGSIPTPSSWTRVYGGNTSCVEVRLGDTVIICDAGSGIRELGKDLLKRTPRPRELHLFITHTHWDHIQGFPFFVPAYLKEMNIHVYGEHAQDDSRYSLLSGQMSSDYFPVSFRDLGARVICDHLEAGSKQIDGVTVRSFPLNHPGGCCGFVFEHEGRRIAYATDNELVIPPGDRFPDPGLDGPLRGAPAALVEAVRGADLLITDAQYDDAQYATKVGWGHSSCISATDFAIQAGAKSVALFHHDPESTDRDVDLMVRSCWQRAAQLEAELVVMAAREGMELKF
jgi:phosphoribosyl 1,2-cyclic phosphodiesterase